MYVITGRPRVPAPVLAFKPVYSITLFLNVLHQFGEPGSANASLAVRCVRSQFAPLMAAARSAKRTRSKTKGTPMAARSFQSWENSIEIEGNAVRRTHWFIEA